MNAQCANFSPVSVSTFIVPDFGPPPSLCRPAIKSDLDPFPVFDLLSRHIVMAKITKIARVVIAIVAAECEGIYMIHTVATTVLPMAWHISEAEGPQKAALALLNTCAAS